PTHVGGYASGPSNVIAATLGCVPALNLGAFLFHPRLTWYEAMDFFDVVVRSAGSSVAGLDCRPHHCSRFRILARANPASASDSAAPHPPLAATAATDSTRASLSVCATGNELCQNQRAHHRPD